MNMKIKMMNSKSWATLVAFFGVLTLVRESAADTGLDIASFSPTNGPVDTRITITGNDLITATNVEFNGTSAGFTTFGNELIATVPANATTGFIRVFTPFGVATSTNIFVVTTVAPPLIAGFSPTSGPVGTSVTIFGQNFSGVKMDAETSSA